MVILPRDHFIITFIQLINAFEEARKESRKNDEYLGIRVGNRVNF